MGMVGLGWAWGSQRSSSTWKGPSWPGSLARMQGHSSVHLIPCRELTPLEEASLQNQKLKAAYEARVARLNPSQAVQKTSLVSGELGTMGPMLGL